LIYLFTGEISMNMKHHILAALSEVFDQWEELLASLTEDQITTALLPSDLPIKDVVAHLMAWQQRSIARVEAARLDREPEFPKWPAALDPEAEDVDSINAWIYESYRQQPWSQVHQTWADGFRRFLKSAEQISERDLLDGGRYAWLKDYPLALILLGSYDHHQEHIEKLQGWLKEHGKIG
jgi:hypothetical protein